MTRFLFAELSGHYRAEVEDEGRMTNAPMRAAASYRHSPFVISPARQPPPPLPPGVRGPSTALRQASAPLPMNLPHLQRRSASRDAPGAAHSRVPKPTRTQCQPSRWGHGTPPPFRIFARLRRSRWSAPWSVPLRDALRFIPHQISRASVRSLRMTGYFSRASRGARREESSLDFSPKKRSKGTAGDFGLKSKLLCRHLSS
jgi:hypothetical protein